MPTGEKRSRWLRGLPALVLLLHAALLAWSGAVHSPTANEPAHLAAAISHWQKQRFELYRVNPPLVRMVAAIPVQVIGVETDWSRFREGPGARPVFAIGEDLMKANREKVMVLFAVARWACIPFSLIGGLVCYLWARDLFGIRAGRVALLLWCFSPNILGHAALLTPDAAATALGLAACYTFWLWLKNPSWKLTWINGLVLGIAELSKTTLVVFYPLWPLLWLLYRMRDRKSMNIRDWGHEGLMLVARMVICIYVINTGYGFEGSFTRLGEYEFVSSALKGDIAESHGNRFSRSVLASLPVPFPQNYVRGIDIQRYDFENFPRPSYLRGTFQEHGWWYYYLYAMGIKVPLGTWSLALLVVLLRLGRKLPRGTGRDEIFLLLPPLTIMVLVSSQTGFNEHLRYVLPVFPFLFIWVSQIVAPAPTTGGSGSRLRSVACGGLLAWSIFSSLAVYPHSLSYFNGLVGGPDHGHAHLIHSNIDWGQDLFFLKQWTDQNPAATPLYLATYSAIDPGFLGIRYRAAVPDDSGSATAETASRWKPGYYAISVNLLRGYPHRIYDGKGGKTAVDSQYLARFIDLPPVKKIGYSIYIYHVEPSDVPAETGETAGEAAD